jgi:hypothetical protein
MKYPLSVQSFSLNKRHAANENGVEACGIRCAWREKVSQGPKLELDRRVGVKGEGCRYLVRMSQRPEV